MARVAAVLLVVLAAILVAGCSEQGDGSGEDRAGGQKPKTVVVNEGMSKEEEERLNERLDELEEEVNDRPNEQQPAEQPAQETEIAEDAARAAAQDYYVAAADGHYLETYSELDSDAQNRFTEDEWVAANAALGSDAASYSVDSVSMVDDSTAEVYLTITASDGSSSQRFTRFVLEDGSWKHELTDEEYDLFATADPASASASASASAGAGSGGSGGDHETTVTVSRVVDGDTIEISPRVQSMDEVRLIGVDTPETVDPEESIEPMGPEASDFATEELSGQSVDLEFDVERTDQYDRLLAYVWLRPGAEMFNEVLLEQGYAQAYPYEPNTRYEGRFAEAQDEAQTASLGIWSLSHAEQCELADRGNGIGEGTPGCEGSSASASASTSASATSSASASADPGGGGGGGAVSPISEENCPPNAPIKGNESSGIYHMPDDAYYDATHPEECFATPQDAEDAGYRAAKV